AQRRAGPDDRRPRARPAADHRAAGRDLRPPVEPGLARRSPSALRRHDAMAAVRRALSLSRSGGMAGHRHAIADLDRALGDGMDAGITPGSPEANQLIERHREVFASHFPLTRQMQVCLGRRFEADPAFAAYYD